MIFSICSLTRNFTKSVQACEIKINRVFSISWKKYLFNHKHLFVQFSMFNSFIDNVYHYFTCIFRFLLPATISLDLHWPEWPDNDSSRLRLAWSASAFHCSQYRTDSEWSRYLQTSEDLECFYGWQKAQQSVIE